MNLRYSLTEDEFDRLRRCRESIELVSILLDEGPRSNTTTPKMMASFMSVMSEEMDCVLQSVNGTFSEHQGHRK